MQIFDHSVTQHWLSVGEDQLKGLPPLTSDLESIRGTLLSLIDLPLSEVDDILGWLSCIQALASVSSGNFGIGALILDRNGFLWTQGHNEVMQPYFRSDAHAEMVVLSRFEAEYPDLKLPGLMLYTSLEPCPMCYTRLLISAIEEVVFVASDTPGGMVSRKDHMPPYWRSMENNCRFRKAQINPVLEQCSLTILSSNHEALMARVNPDPLNPEMARHPWKP